MSRSMAGFALVLYVCAVSGQQYPRIRLKGTGDEPSIVIDQITGGKYPAGSFSIGYGDNNPNGDGRPGADYGSSGGQVDHEGGYVNGENDIGGYGGQNSYNNQNGYTRNSQAHGVNEYGVPVQNPGQKPASPYNTNYNENVPLRNSAAQHYLSSIWRYITSWF